MKLPNYRDALGRPGLRFVAHNMAENDISEDDRMYRPEATSHMFRLSSVQLTLGHPL